MAKFILTSIILVVTTSYAFIESDSISSPDHSALLHLISQERSLRLELETQVHYLQGQVQALQYHLNSNTVIVDRNKQQVAFSVKLHNNVPLSTTSNVKFDDVITNIGSAYNTTSGIFKCPVDGLYLISLNILSDLNGMVIAPVYQNGKVIARPFTGTGTNEHESGSDTVVVHGKVGDEIYVKNLIGSSAYLDNMSLFTGMLLKAD